VSRRRSFATTALILGLVLVVGSAAAYYAVTKRYAAAAVSGPPTATGTPAPGPTSAPAPTTTPPPPTQPAKVTYPSKGPDTYRYASGTSAVFGSAGTLRRYRVAVETGISVSPDDFASFVDSTLGDPRSWIAGRNVRLQRVPGDGAYQFTVYLVTPQTAYRLCLAGGFDIFWRGEPYTSCRVGGRVLINVTRWAKGIPDYGAPLEAYRRYAVNHEVGHVLGHGHELCPGKGKPAPVMQQQTFSLQGCTAYAWPYRDGKRYAGPPGRIVPSG
jgi:hypothetical protein